MIIFFRKMAHMSDLSDSFSYMEFLANSPEEEDLNEIGNDEEDELFRISNGQKMIYEGSDIKLSEFVVVFF